MREIETRWHPVASPKAFVDHAIETILKQADAAVAARGAFHVALAGGNTPRPVYEALRETDTDWSSWQVYFGDERCLPAGDAGRNSVMARQTLLDHVPIPAEQVHVIAGEEGAYDAANDYSRILRRVNLFDLVLLGLGEDGHTASLFPSRYWGIERDSRAALAVYDAPKPPAERVTLSSNRLSRSRSVLFLVDGESKRDAVTRWRDGGSLPAATIRPSKGVDVLLPAGLLA